MNYKKRKNKKRLRNLITICLFVVILLIAATYAWFIGLQKVNITSFDVEIAASESLLLSLNGEDWDDTLTISNETIKTNSYVGNPNNWGSRGLGPMSSIGEIDSTYSRMKLFEKASLTSTYGGFRLMASRVNNYGASEKDGYIVFDLFIKNFSGTQYIKELNDLNEEGIYLTTDSEVVVSSSGKQGTGIENSVRVAFAQIGRVSGNETNPGLITGITCNPPVASDVTGICRPAQIWEPNDLFHEENAIKWYQSSCKARTGVNVRLPGSYDGECGTIEDGVFLPTYAVASEISATDNVDVYDGAEYNSYTNSSKLFNVTTFTDSMKNIVGTARPTFMTLQPNSITKLKVYIWIEGQDIDNYDYAVIGKSIAINFGFTKQKITEEDFNYQNPIE